MFSWEQGQSQEKEPGEGRGQDNTFPLKGVGGSSAWLKHCAWEGEGGEVAEGEDLSVRDICLPRASGFPLQIPGADRGCPTGDSHTVGCQEYVCLLPGRYH